MLVTGWALFGFAPEASVGLEVAARPDGDDLHRVRTDRHGASADVLPEYEIDLDGLVGTVDRSRDVNALYVLHRRQRVTLDLPGRLGRFTRLRR